MLILHWAHAEVLTHTFMWYVRTHLSLLVRQTYTILDDPSLPISTLGGNRKWENLKICTGKCRLIMSDLLDIGLKRPDCTSSGV